MAIQQVDGSRQLKSGSVGKTQTDNTLVAADGSRAFTADQSMGGFKLTNVANGTAAGDAANFGQISALLNGLDQKGSVRAASTANVTVASALINGATMDGVTLATGDEVLLKDQTAPAENGIWVVAASGAAVRAARADASAEVTGGFTVWVNEGTVNGDTQWTLTTNDPITLGTTGLTFSQTDKNALTFSGGLTKTGNAVTREALTGDVTASAGSNATTIAAGVVTLAKMANLAANSVIGNPTGSSATPSAVAMASAATASALVVRDGNANARFNNVIENTQDIVSAAGNTVLVVGSPRTTRVTGSTTQTVTLPDATTLVVGQIFRVVNRSSANVTVNANGGGLIQTMVPASFVELMVTATGTAAGTWDAAYTSAGGSGSVTSVSVTSANGFAGSVATNTTTPAITISTTVTGVLKGNGTAISAAVAGTDFLAPSSRVTRETPTGSINGSNTSFTLANTPIVGTEEVYLNGLQQEPGAGNDYTISGATITYLTAPIAGDKIRVSYFK